MNNLLKQKRPNGEVQKRTEKLQQITEKNIQLHSSNIYELAFV